MNYIDDQAQVRFAFIEPPFQFNDPAIAKYTPEVSGFHILRTMGSRLGWDSLRGKRILDFGCGIRLARTLVNLGVDVGLYVGIDVNKTAIEWLQQNIEDPRFKFFHVNDLNPMYNPEGDENESFASLKSLASLDFDVASMFSVITHQRPREAQRIFALLHQLLNDKSRLYFTAFLDPKFETYGEAHESECMMSTYHPDYLTEVLAQSGWRVDAIYERTTFQQFALICSRQPLS